MAVEAHSADLKKKVVETVRVDRGGAVVETLRAEVPVFSEDLGGGASLELAAVPAGFFSMGSSGAQGYPDEQPRHQVRIPAFFMSETAVTQRQWKAVMGTLPPCRGKGEDNPVDRVSWTAARVFCERLSQLTRRTYRLPAEAEWEYACRAGGAGPFHFGETITTQLANYVGLHTYAAETKGDYRHGPVAVKSFPPNLFGLYDMHGNLFEWCEDAWHPSYEGAPDDGSAWLRGGGPEKVLRGGSWHDPPDLCRSAARLKLLPAEGEDYAGFRVALSTLDLTRPKSTGLRPLLDRIFKR